MDFLKYLHQTAVYWGNPQDDGEGGYTFDAPIEIKCRWSDRRSLITNKEGREIVSRAKILVDRELMEEGYLYLGTLNDLTAGQKTNPLSIAGRVRWTNAIPDFTASNFLYIVWL